MSLAAQSATMAESFSTSRRNRDLAASNPGSEDGSDTDDHSLAAIVAACQNRDRTAQRQLYESCRQIVYRLAVRMVGVQEAADVTQQVFLQAYRKVGQFNGKSRFTTWLYRLAVNESLQHLRRRKRWKHESLEWEPMDNSADRQDVERKEVLEQALGRVDPELRSIFLLKEVEGLCYREIADALQIPEGTVGSRLNRARRELQQIIMELGFELQ